MFGVGGRVIAGSAIRNAGGGDTSWDISSAVPAGKVADVSEDDSPVNVFFKPDGLTMYMGGRTTDTIYQYTLDPAWDVSSSTYANKSVDVSTDTPTFISARMNDDGTLLYTLDTTDKVNQYTVSSAYDIGSTVTFDATYSITNESTDPTGITFSTDGTKMYIVDASTDEAYQYTLTTAWDIGGTVTYNTSVNLKADATTLTQPGGIFFSDDGTKMFVSDTSADSVFQFTLSTAWLISSATYDSVELDVSGESIWPGDLAFSADGTILYVTALVPDEIVQYTL